MRAAAYSRQGPAADVLRLLQLPTPTPGPGEVRVRLKASGANPSDWKARAGARGAGLPHPLVVPHSDGAGLIDAAGDGLAHRIGERVWVWNGQWRRAFGTAADYIVLPSEQAVRLPDEVSFEIGACLGIPAFTAWQAVRKSNLAPGMDVLIAGGAGAVGHYAVQLAKRAGARVVTTVSSPGKREHAASAGPDEIVDYRREDIVERVQAFTSGRGVDVVIDLDLATNAKAYPRLLRPHGAAVVYGTSSNDAVIPSLWLMRNSIELRFLLIYDIGAQDRRAGIAALTDLMKGQELRHTVAATLPLERIADAHELGESGSAVGNIVLTIDS
jgi:NADPH2:quinone reductase